MSSSSYTISSSSSEYDDLDKEMTEVSSILREKTGVSIGKLLGEGTFGKVFAARRSNGKELALKKIVTSKKEQEISAKYEIEVLTLLKTNKFTAHLSHLHFCFSNADSIYMMLDRMDINLLELMELRTEEKKQIQLEEVICIGKQVLSGLHCLHSLNIVHTDLQPSNIMVVSREVQPYRVKIIDFGCAQPRERLQRLHASEIQSPGYNAPESILGSLLSEKIDIFSVGVILSELYAAIPLFPATSDFQMLKFIIAVCGMPPVQEDSLHRDRYLNKNDITANGLSMCQYRLKSEDEMNEEDLGDADVEMIYPYKGLSRLILFGANHQSGFGLTQDVQFINWIGSLLNVHPELRPNASEALQSEIFGTEKKPTHPTEGPIRREKNINSPRSKQIYKKQSIKLIAY